jgi:ribosomal protein L16/L10AE
MGKGVGKVKSWITFIKRGSIFIEMLGISKKLAIKSFKAIKYILPIKVNFIFRDLLTV